MAISSSEGHLIEMDKESIAQWPRDAKQVWVRYEGAGRGSQAGAADLCISRYPYGKALAALRSSIPMSAAWRGSVGCSKRTDTA
jgi:hypothetical protein